MKKKIVKYTLSCCIVSGLLISTSFAATTERGWKIYETLKDDGRTNGEIRMVLADQGYNANEYMGGTNNSINRGNSSSATTQLGREILDELRRKGRTDEEIIEKIEDLGYDPSAYFPSYNKSYTQTPSYNESYTQTPSSYNSSIYTSRSCKNYTIEYIDSLNAYTSPDLIKREYFLNTDYFKRYIDSKNIPNAECSLNKSRISTPYDDRSYSNERFVAPNGKIYFITKQDGYYTSNDLSTGKRFGTLDELRGYVRQHNPLVSM